MTKTLKLGLIGDHIETSRSPLLHRLAGKQHGIDVQYDRLIPGDLGQDFIRVFEVCRTGGYAGINITYPYKERVLALIAQNDPMAAAMGAVNTVIFEERGPRGHNTDYLGFVAAYRRVLGNAPTGPVLMIGAGGVGRAIAFGLVQLGARELRLVDHETSKAEALAEALLAYARDVSVRVWPSAERAANGVDGVINCTPVGMSGHQSTPLSRDAMAGGKWAFDAVYTPVDTRFLKNAAAEGLAIISGWELFFYQGTHAWKLFSGLDLDEVALRYDLFMLEDTG